MRETLLKRWRVNRQRALVNRSWLTIYCRRRRQGMLMNEERIANKRHVLEAYICFLRSTYPLEPLLCSMGVDIDQEKRAIQDCVEPC